MNILVSACLLGSNVKYDGTNNADRIDERSLAQLKSLARLIPFCPEVSGGLSTPRIPCEVKDAKVINRDGQDQTEFFMRGAELALKECVKNNCSIALLKEKSPSCGHGQIYDGTFSHTTISGSGITARLLSSNGIRIFGESEIQNLISQLQ